MRISRTPLLLPLVVVIIALVWRYASRRYSIPCPSWLGAILTGSWSDRLLGTEITLDRTGLEPGLRVLEVGPGPGRLLVPAARRVLPGGEVVGLDIQPRMVQKLRARAEREGVTNLTAFAGDAARQHFEPETFDVVYLSTVLGEIPNRHAALSQCYDVLKPGGTLSVTEIFPDPHFQTQVTVRRLAEEAGFRFRSVEGSRFFFTANFTK